MALKGKSGKGSEKKKDLRQKSDKKIEKKADKKIREITDKKIKKIKTEEKKINKALDKFSNELDAFLNKTKGISVEKLASREQAPYYIDTGNYALNWVLTDDFFKGFPGTKAIQVAGECLGPDTLIVIKEGKDTNELMFKTIEAAFKSLFDMRIAVIDAMYNIKHLNLFIPNENNEWIPIVGAIIKKKQLRKIRFSDDSVLICSDEHLICLNKNMSSDCIKAKDIRLGSEILKAVNNEILTVIENESLQTEGFVYDLQVESDTHLYQDALGFVHHNSGKGKSLICDQFLGNIIKADGIAYKVEVEDAGGREFTAAIVGSKEIADQIRIIEPTKDDKGNMKPITIEKLTQFLNNLVTYQISKKSNVPILVVIDSVSQLTSDKEFEDVRKEKDTRDMTVQQKMRAFFRVLTPQQRLANLTIIGIAHMTANIGVMFGPKTTINSKGSGFKYASSLDIEVKGNKEIKGKSDVGIGQLIKFKTSKNRFTHKGREVWIRFYYHGGIDRYSGLAQILAKFGIFKASAKPDINGFFKDSVSFTWNDLKFKENDIPTLLKEHGEEKLLKQWMKELNDEYEAICRREGKTEESILNDRGESEEEDDDLEQLPDDE